MSAPLAPEAGAVLFRQFAAAHRHKVPLADVLEILTSDRQWFKEEDVERLQSALLEETTLAAALARRPEWFDVSTVRLIDVGEALGRLPEVFDALADDFQRLAAARSDHRVMLAWPSLTLIIAILILSASMIFVLPAFEAVYTSFGMNLPPLTRVLLAISEYAWLLLVFMVLVGFAYFTGRMKDILRAIAAMAFDRIRFVRRAVTASFVTRLAGWLRVCGNDGALQIAVFDHLRDSTKSLRLAAAAERVSGALSMDASLVEALSREPLLPARIALYARLAVALNDFSGPYSQALELAELEEIEARSDYERGLMVVTYIGLAILVGMVVLAIYQPIFKLGGIV